MHRRFIAAFALIALALGAFPARAVETEYNPHFLVSDREMLDVNGMNLPALQAFLASRGTLGSYATTDRDGVRRSAAEIIHRNARLFGINPKFLLVLLQREQSLVEHGSPSQGQFDWAMGYAICDDCSKDDQLLQKYRGFANQIYYASKRIRESYLADLEELGRTVSGVGPDITAIIDGQPVIPANRATAVLYTYTPHLHGNKNFVRIWNRWFTPNYPHGSLLQNADTGEIWRIRFDRKLPITSPAAFYSRYDADRLIPVTDAVLATYESGPPISFPNYALLKAPDNDVFLLVDDELRWIPDMETFRSIGFNTDEIIDVTDADLAAYREGLPLSAKAAYPKGALVQNPDNGGVFYVESGVKRPIHAKEILDAQYAHLPLLPAAPEELASYETGEPVRLPDGTLVAAHGSPDVFVIADGKRRHIADEAVFLQYGWAWKSIVRTNERSVLIHPLGEPLEIQEAETEWSDIETALNAD